MKEDLIVFVLCFVAFMTGLGLVTMGVDKYRAMKNKWRISESSLICIALCGGGIGSFLGMKIFHHKTRHRKFYILLPLLALFYGFVIAYLLHLLLVYHFIL